MLHNSNRPLLSAIVAMDENRAIGYQNPALASSCRFKALQIIDDGSPYFNGSQNIRIDRQTAS